MRVFLQMIGNVLGVKNQKLFTFFFFLVLGSKNAEKKLLYTNA